MSKLIPKISFEIKYDDSDFLSPEDSEIILKVIEDETFALFSELMDKKEIDVIEYSKFYSRLYALSETLNALIKKSSNFSFATNKALDILLDTIKRQYKIAILFMVLCLPYGLHLLDEVNSNGEEFNEFVMAIIEEYEQLNLPKRIQDLFMEFNNCITFNSQRYKETYAQADNEAKKIANSFLQQFIDNEINENVVLDNRIIDESVSILKPYYEDINQENYRTYLLKAREDCSYQKAEEVLTKKISKAYRKNGD